jgi:hypothetical protein
MEKEKKLQDLKNETTKYLKSKMKEKKW